MQKRYLEIARAIQREVEQGVFAPGSTVPGRVALASRFDVTRATIDRAMRVLIQRGVLVSRQGAGTFVSETPPQFKIACVDGSHSDKMRASELDCSISILHHSKAIEQGVLNDYDGVVWCLPNPEMVAFIRKQEGCIPQIVVNRQLDDLDYVSTDHRGAIYAMTGERLDMLPDAVPVFLSVTDINRSIPYLQRREGFVDACRERNRFYEELFLPMEYDGKIEMLANLRQHYPDRPLLLVSATMHHSGAVAFWMRHTGQEWKKDVWYCDFDNGLEAFYYGIRFSSFLQDIPQLTFMALEKLLGVLLGVETSVQVLIPPVRVDGDT